MAWRIKDTLQVCRAYGCTASWRSDIQEYRICPRGSGEEQAYYTDDAEDAMLTAVEMASHIGKYAECHAVA